jgi:hypothetical protein
MRVAGQMVENLMYAGTIGSASLSFLANRAEPNEHARSGARSVRQLAS